MAATATHAPSPLALALERRNVDEAQWNTLANSLFPGARPDSVLLVIDYCRARRLDPMKKPCHIVPMRFKQGDAWIWRDVVMPGIYEYRTTAIRTGKYLGHSTPEYGPDKEQFGVTAPEWCAMTMYRALEPGVAEPRIEFPVRVYFREAVALKDGKANDRWARAPFQMLTKCTEAAGLREAFPDEFGGEATAEEMAGRGDDGEVIDAAPIKAAQRVSQAAPAAVPPRESAPAAVAAAAPDGPPSSIGVIAEVLDRSQGAKIAALVRLDSGFKAATANSELISAAAALRDRGARVELVTKPSSDPARFAPVLEAIDVLPTTEAPDVPLD